MMPSTVNLEFHEFTHRPLPEEYCSAQKLHAHYSALALDFFKRHAHDGVSVPDLLYAVYEQEHCLRVFECVWNDPIEKIIITDAIRLMFNQHPPDRYCYQSEVWLAAVKTIEEMYASPPASERPDRLDGLVVLTVDRQLPMPLFQSWVRRPMGQGVSVDVFNPPASNDDEGQFGGRMADLMKPFGESSEMRILREVSREDH